MFDLPPQREQSQRGRPKLKGDKICMNLRASHNQGWQETECQLYGKRITKTYKMFVAVSEMTVYKPARVVIIQEADGKQEIRKLDISTPTTVMNMMYCLTELICWNVPTKEIVDRSATTASELSGQA
ncbi:MAG: hypothetical protein LBU65_01240 [Planctomycetaceae bacterium]|nr:hypothetical protein [Planctomycetaceae bacterium]